MPVYSCPKGHDSSESDFCSECGAKIQGAPPSSGPRPGPSASLRSSQTCPDCGAPRAETSSNFCEVCGYNFLTGTHGNVPDELVASPLAAPPPESAAPAASPPPEPVQEAPAQPTPPSTATPKQWTITVAVDASLRDPAGPEPPAGTSPVQVKLEKPISLIGRKSEKRAILPEVSLDLDDGVSHRHALLTRGDDGSLTLRDIGSSNGTRLNGKDVQQLVDIALNDGDQVTLGRWTRLTLKAV